MADPTQKLKPLQPFEHIGLCFSGGGYRATAFSLGVLDYLNRIQFKDKVLLDHVIAISSVSGGTITGAFFAACNAKGIPFQEFYDKLFKFLKEDKLVDDAVSKFMDEAFWKTTSRTRSLINSFALTYHEKLVEDKFDILCANLKEGSLKYACFNATEFNFGLAFRFQNVNIFGNFPLDCTELQDILPEIRIADAIASSSCFPVGFEPMLFPNDYIENHQSPAYLNLKQRPNFTGGIGIMDGGIVDNQGIGSIVNLNNSDKPEVPMDLIIVNDVGSFSMPPWTPSTEPIQKRKKESIYDFILGLLRFVQLRPIYWIGFLVGILLMVTASAISFFKGSNWGTLYSIAGIIMGVFGLITVLGFAGSFTVNYIKGKFNKAIQSIVPHNLLDDVVKLKNLDVPTVKRMINERASSGLLMIDQIFFRQIRRLNFDLFYQSDQFKNRRITSTVYQLNGEQTSLRSSENIGEFSKKPIPDRIKESALIASRMATTLWWTEADLAVQRQENLIACGQYTTCYNLISYIEGLPSEYHEELKGLKDVLYQDWEKFSNDPLVFVKSK